MNAWLILGMLLIVGLIWWYEWSRLGKAQKREKTAVAVLLCLGAVLAVMLIINPDLPGPSQMIHALFRPLGEILEK
ncbi:hypothetical protein ETC05_09090 [Geobacillus sp. BMUD]|uniref:hypothetical protein n=1 Tax=Geobacillus sp. BMUD TaxID=2508876 RepID=UPI0014918634|nr:hypothetical protein [Geobacillus sp. BMUD]NNU83995.1 hypothetical protein [Geobacillus sp. BMUD]